MSSKQMKMLTANSKRALMVKVNRHLRKGWELHDTSLSRSSVYGTSIGTKFSATMMRDN